MSKELIISPEGLELANAYLEFGSIKEASAALHIPLDKASQMLEKAEVKRYLDNVYLDLGYRNRNKLGALLDEIIDSKLEEARESEVYSSKDLLDIIKVAHKMRMDEIEAAAKHDTTNIKQQTNVQINESPFGQGNYGKLMEKLLNDGEPV